MILSATDRAFLRGQFPGLRGLTDQAIDTWFWRTHVAGNPLYDTDESFDR